MRVILLSLLLLLSLPSVASDEPRGIRNNNPANLVSTRIKWQGEVKCRDKRFECFKTPYHGIRAMYKNLYSYYYRHNKRTLGQIMHKWSPSHENNTHRIVRYLSKRLRSPPDAIIDIMDMDYLYKLGSSLIKVENGKNPYSKKTYYRAIKNVFGKRIKKYDIRRKAKKVLSNDSLSNRMGIQGRIRDYSRGFLGTRSSQRWFISLQETSCRSKPIQRRKVPKRNSRSFTSWRGMGTHGWFLGGSFW